jgi:cellulose synthase/poly-beta-1,6-N-acetylglucosamine synthase-like glycosyltransferase
MTTIILASILLFFYAILISLVTIGWYRTPVFRDIRSSYSTRVSIVLAARNEEQNIQRLLNDLLQQDYSSSFMEIIVVDDHSEDQTMNRVKEFVGRNGNRISIIELTGQGISGKKAAIDFGIKHSTGELILTTDADCRLLPSWVRTIVSFYETSHPEMILSPVRFAPDSGLFSRLQELEFMSLIATTAGSTKMGFPLMANGANLAYTRVAYNACRGFSDNISYPSGDDVFMMISVKKQYGNRAIKFLKSTEALVSTLPELRVKDFISQRLRWVSKSRGVKDIPILLTSILVYLTNLALACCLVWALVHAETGSFALTLFLVKLLIDLPVMIGMNRFLGRQKLLWLFPLLELINAVYIVIIGLTGNLKSFTWKGRRFKP